ncbi:copper homeostasis protein CutC [Breznakia sp. PF5-3]|nr:copper homeostasis protein CutC [Breznakia sp. PM6-1]MDF9834664.1 copper homeostasis protein CutC [Breznakia sp. PF5-3]MDF9836901.1 copper homeostasis protein CutC [Breznakia sp. PFB2-8]MDF9858918.1 copper homeostasis protein CutC [Breznakia sp. PH5-24]
MQICGGIRSHNVEKLQKMIKVSNIHSACRVFQQDRSDEKANVLNYSNAYDKVSKEEVQRMHAILKPHI